MVTTVYSGLVSAEVDGIDMGITRSVMIRVPGTGDAGRFRVEWSYPVPRPSTRHKQRIDTRDHDCNSLDEAEAYVTARTKHEGHRPGFMIRIIDRADLA